MRLGNDPFSGAVTGVSATADEVSVHGAISVHGILELNPKGVRRVNAPMRGAIVQASVPAPGRSTRDDESTPARCRQECAV
jgi:hypothetical protein